MMGGCLLLQQQQQEDEEEEGCLLLTDTFSPACYNIYTTQPQADVDAQIVRAAQALRERLVPET
jgi:hypothetical protein